jgi:hypothetical protein
VNGELKDLATRVDETDAVEPVTIDSPDGLNILRHSAAHVLAQAVQNMFPEAKLGIGPPITDGFYYDFDVAEPFTPEDLKSLDKEMARIIRQGQRFMRRVVTDDEARAELAADCGDDVLAFARSWHELAARWRFDDVNELIERHNRFFPAESRLPMDPLTGDFVLIDGDRYEKEPLDAGWILDRFPPDVELAA